MPRLVAVMGAKGGCGATLITANLAASLLPGPSVCAMDLDFGKGDLAALLDLVPARPLPELFGPGLDVAMLHGSASRHDSGLLIVGQPQDMTRLVRPSGAELRQLLQLARQTWDQVFCDFGSRVDDAVVAGLAVADQVLIVTQPDLVALRDTARLRALLHHLDVPASKQWLVVNHTHAHAGLSPAEIEDFLRIHVDATLPCDERACARAAFGGALLGSVAPASALTHELGSLWNLLTTGAPAPRRWRLPWLGGSP